MICTILRRATLSAAALAGALTLVGLPLTSASAADTAVTVATGPSGINLSTDTVLAGQIDFTFTSSVPESQMGGGSDVAIIRRHNNVTLAQVVARIRAENTGPDATPEALVAAAAATKWLANPANLTIYGGAAIQGVGSAHTVNILGPGTYQMLNLNSVFAGPASPVEAKPLQVTGHIHPSLTPRISSTIDTTSADRFSATSTHLKVGAKYLIRNVADTIHFVDFAPVKPGTTDADIAAAIAAIQNGQQPMDPYLHDKVGVQSEVMSPGRSQVFSSSLLTAGTYDLECFIADDMTGMPHFFMGMHKIVRVGPDGTATSPPAPAMRVAAP